MKNKLTITEKSFLRNLLSTEISLRNNFIKSSVLVLILIIIVTVTKKLFSIYKVLL
jgi:hypothetical protein